jgi:hypothetical protein
MRLFSPLLPLLFSCLALPVSASEPTIRIDTPLTPPTWALLERQLLDTNAAACRRFFARYFDERGFLLCVERWGGDDGPDDAPENVGGWAQLHALGAADDVLSMYRTAWEGHLRQYTLARTVEVPFARDGMYYKEFPVMFDWQHNGEGLRLFNLQGLSDYQDTRYGHRVRRYAGFYMNEDPGAPNYDPRHKIIRSMINGSRGPLMRKATGLDWAGDPIEIENRFHLGHGERNYAEMVAHFKDYNDVVGDHPLNLIATTLPLNAYLLTGEAKYRNWLIEYVDAWLGRMKQNGNVIPSNIGLDGTIGGATQGKWYGGTYGWSFTVTVPQTGLPAHRNRQHWGFVGMMNAYFLTGDDKYLEAWRKQTARVNAQKRMVDGKALYPRMFGDNGWYHWVPEPYSYNQLEIYYLSMKPTDRKYLEHDPWLRFLDGNNDGFAETALRRDLAEIQRRSLAMNTDTTTPDTRLADDPTRYNPAQVTALRQLMVGGLDPGRRASVWHTRLRYFDPANRRAGIPDDCAALIDRMTDTTTRVQLVNTNQLQGRELIVQAGAYAEHAFRAVEIGSRRIPLHGPTFRVRLGPGAGATLTLTVDRHSRTPTMHFPWATGLRNPSPSADN